MIDQTFTALVIVFAGLFPIINPLGTALIFFSMTRRATHVERAEVSKRIAIYSFLIINASLYFGAYVLQVFGVSIPIMRVAGGIVVMMAGWKLLNADSLDTEDVKKPGKGEDLLQLSFYPLTMPLTVGPGSIAASIALGTGRTTMGTHLLTFLVGATLGAGAIAGLIYVCYRYADRIETALGATASDAICRMFAFILMCIGVAILWSGISELILELQHQHPVAT